jgi:hypothetical protein
LRKDYVILCHWSGHGEQHTSTMKIAGKQDHLLLRRQQED